ncbi:MAG: hypothetical protein K9M44_00185 [Candidatus Pacebacteria bacterium]|nr:hypothetical protein [Candidatus Paceibacterota bacterium]
MSIKKSKIEDKSIRLKDSDGLEEKRPKDSDGQEEYNYPGKVTIKASSKEEADEKFKKLKNK